MLRRPDRYIAKRAIDWNPNGKRKRGKSQHTWSRIRMAELKERQLTWQEAKRTSKIGSGDGHQCTIEVI